MPWGARQPLPPWPPPPLGDPISKGCAPPLGAYIKGGRAAHTAFGASLLPCNTSFSLSLSLSRRSSAKPCRRAATSTTTPSCCRSSPSTSPLPFLDQEGGDTPGYMCVEHGGAVRSALDRIFPDLNRREYDSLIRVLVTLPLRDLQRYEDAHPLPLLLLESP